MRNHDDSTRMGSEKRVTAMTTVALAVFAYVTMVGGLAIVLTKESKDHTDSSVPSVAVLIANNTAEIEALRTDMNARFDGLSEQFDRRFDGLNEQMDRRFNEQSEDWDRRFREQSEDWDRRFREQSEDRDRRFDELRQWLIDTR